MVMNNESPRLKEVFSSMTNDYHHDDYIEEETELSCRTETAIGICCVVIQTR